MAVDPWVCGDWTLQVPTQSQHVQLIGKKKKKTSPQKAARPGAELTLAWGGLALG